MRAHFGDTVITALPAPARTLAWRLDPLRAHQRGGCTMMKHMGVINRRRHTPRCRKVRARYSSPMSTDDVIKIPARLLAELSDPDRVPQPSQGLIDTMRLATHDLSYQ